jgi:CDP-diglyceride synthetase
MSFIPARLHLSHNSSRACSMSDVRVTAVASNNGTSSKSNPWKDVPQRLATIFIALPLLWNVWQQDGLRHAFFQCVHVLCALEWSHMTMWLMMPSSKSWSSNEGNNSKGAKGLDEKTPSLQQLRNSLSLVSDWRVWLFPAVSCSLVNISSPNCFLLCLVLILVVPTVFLVPHNSTAASAATTTGTATTQLSQAPISTALAWHQGSLFITIPFRTWLLLTRGPHGFVPTVSLLVTVWNCDTGALVAGRLWGGMQRRRPIEPTRESAAATTTAAAQYVSTLNVIRRQLYAISPKKSIEGWCGALVAGTLTYVILVPMLWTYLGQHADVQHDTASIADTNRNSTAILEDVVVGLALSVAAIVGDTWESAVKRHYRVKDTSRFLPGHGGILDRFDSSLIAVLVHCVHLETSARARHRGY